MTSSFTLRRVVASLLIGALLTPSFSVFAQSSPNQPQQAPIRVTRKAADQYAVVNSEVVVLTKYCHEYVTNEEVLLTTRDEGAENLMYFASGAVCEVVGVDKPSDRRFGLIDFLMQLGLLLLGKRYTPSAPPATTPTRPVM